MFSIWLGDLVGKTIISFLGLTTMGHNCSRLSKNFDDSMAPARLKPVHRILSFKIFNGDRLTMKALFTSNTMVHRFPHRSYCPHIYLNFRLII